MISSKKTLLLAVASVFCGSLQTRGDVLRWSFGLRSPEGLVDARENVPLSEAAGDWSQLFGRDADPAAPDLYPRTPEASLVTRNDGGGRLLSLRAFGGRAFLISRSRPITDLPRFELRGAVDTSGLGHGALNIAVKFLGKDGVTLLGESSRALVQGARLELDGTVPSGSAFAALTLQLVGGASDLLTTARIESIEMTSLPGFRIAMDRATPLFGAKEDIVLRPAAHGLPRGPHVLCWTLTRVALPDDASGPVCQVGEPLAEGEVPGFAPAHRPAIWTLALPPFERPGSYKLSLRTSAPGAALVLAEEFLFGVVEESPAWPRSAWRRMLEPLASSSARFRYAGALLIPESTSSDDSVVHVFRSSSIVGVAVFLAGSADANDWLLRSDLPSSPPRIIPTPGP